MAVYPKMQPPGKIAAMLTKIEDTYTEAEDSHTPYEGILMTLRWVMGTESAIDLNTYLED